VFARYLFPSRIITYSGPCLIHWEFEVFFRGNEIELYEATLLWSQPNGEVERQNKLILKRLRILKLMGLGWKKSPDSSGGLQINDIHNSRHHTGRIWRQEKICQKESKSETRS
jgi:hypothetical protein